MLKLKEMLQTRKKELTGDFLIEWHHQLMKTYGYMPMEEFKHMKISTFFNLIGKLNRDAEMQNKAIEKMNHSKRGM